MGNVLKQILLSQIYIINKLFKLKIQPEKIDKITILKLKDDIEKIPFRIKRWLYEKVEELEAKAASKNQRTYKRTLSPSKIPVN